MRVVMLFYFHLSSSYRYVLLYGIKFTKEDHILFIKILYEMVASDDVALDVTPDFNLSVYTMLCTLLRLVKSKYAIMEFFFSFWSHIISVLYCENVTVIILRKSCIDFRANVNFYCSKKLNDSVIFFLHHDSRFCDGYLFHRKRRLLVPGDDLTLPWRPLYDICKRLFWCSQIKQTIICINQYVRKENTYKHHIFAIFELVQDLNFFFQRC